MITVARSMMSTILPQSQLSEVPSHGDRGLAGRTASGAPTDLLLSRGLHRAPWIRRHQQDLSDILRRAAAPSLMKLAWDPHEVGGLIGACVCSTPGPVPGLPSPCALPRTGWCGLPDRSQWQPARTSYLVPSMPSRSSFAGCFGRWCVRNGLTCPSPSRSGPRGASSNPPSKTRRRS